VRTFRWHIVLFSYVTALPVIAVDQVTKVLLPTYVTNRGISFGVAAGWGGLPLMSTVLLVVLFVWLSLTAWRQRWSWWGWSGIGAILGGGASNVIDRIFTGAVRDPLVIPFTSLHNNAADYAIFFGMILVLWSAIRRQPVSESETTHGT
jgi:lipoprotein signal peptidase